MRRPSKVADSMTQGSHFTGREQSLAIASERMRRLGIRNLPVIHDGALCGVLSERDIALAESLSAGELAQLRVGAAMGRDLYPVAECTPLAHVVRTMAAHGYGCAVVMERGVVVGVFTASDALRAFSTMLGSASDAHDGLSASEARAVVMTEHAHVDALLLRTHRAVHRLIGSRDPERAAAQVHEQARHLWHAMRSYLELEEHELTPLLSNLTGSSKTCGQHLAQEHIRQIADTAAFAALLEDRELPLSARTQQLEHLLSNLRRDLEREHALLFALEEASNDQVISDAAAD